jgi:hypothetical protein
MKDAQPTAWNLRPCHWLASTALILSAFLAVSGHAHAATSRNHIWDITYPLEKNTGTYVNGWHLCRDSCARAHRAVDIYATPGTPVYASQDGIIRWRRTSAASDWSPTSGSGYALYIDAPGKIFRHFYGHFGPDKPGSENEAFAVNPATGELWKVGDSVKRGQLLGFVGTSGATGSGPHLHFELRSLTAGIPTDDPGDDAEPGPNYGDPDAPIGSFAYLRYDPFPSFQAAEDRGDYPKPPPLQVGDHVMVFDVNTALNVRGPEACDSPISGAGQPNGRVGRIVGGPAQCPQITSHNLWQILWSDCTLGWSSEGNLHGTVAPAEFCQEFGVSVAISGEGTVAFIPEQPIYPKGSTLRLEAVAADEFEFLQWSGSLSSTDNSLIFTVEEDLALIAQFRRTYSAWETSQFTLEERETAGLTGPENDAFGKGIANLAVYAFGLNVRNPDRSDFPRVEREGDDIAFVFRRLKDEADVTYVVEVSSDLTLWSTLGPEQKQWEIIDVPESSAEIVRITLEPDSAGATHFARIRVKRS